MPGLFARLAILLALFGFAFPATAQTDDASDIQSVISQQLDAFRADEGAVAYSFAAPRIKAMSGTEANFMQMVRSGYPPVYRSSNVAFGALEPFGDGFRQEVFMTDPQGQAWVASYTLERQDDGSMKITGVRLEKSEDLAV